MGILEKRVTPFFKGKRTKNILAFQQRRLKVNTVSAPDILILELGTQKSLDYGTQNPLEGMQAAHGTHIFAICLSTFQQCQA